MSDPYEREAAKAAIKVLQRELAEAKNKIERQGARIKYLEGATNHATGTPLTKALEQLDEMRIDRDEWKAVSEGRLLGSIDKVAQLERELAEARDQLEGAGKLMTACDVLVRELAEARTQRDMLAEALQELNDAPWLNMPGRACDIVQDALAALKGGSHE